MTRKRNHTLRYVLALWGLLIILAVIDTIVHEIGFFFVNIVIAAVAYSAGQRNVLSRARANTRKIETNARYGKSNAAHNSYAWGPQGWPNTPGWSSPQPGVWVRDDFGPGDPDGSRGPVMELDAVSPYPPNMTADEANERVTGDPDALRARLLRDKLGGVHNLFRSDNDD